MTRPAPRLVLVDLDGTLADTVPDLAYCVDEMTTALGLPPRGESLVRLWVGDGVDRLIERALVGAMDGVPSPDLLRRAEGIFYRAYERHNGDFSRLTPGARGALTFLRERGAVLVCVTNKPERFTEPLLRGLGVREEFALVLSGDSLPRRKPDPMPVLHALEHFSVAPEEALFVGDSASDVLAAQGAGVPVVCVGEGYNHGSDVRDARPDAVIDSLADLPRLVSAGVGETRAGAPR